MTMTILQPSPQELLHPTKQDAGVVNTILDKGGVTFCTRTNRPARYGYAVSPYKSREVRIPVEDFGAGHVAAYRRINADLLGKSRHYLGGWYNKADNQVYLDIAQVVPLVAAALLLARENQQQAVYDLLTGEEIRLGLN